LPNDEEGSFKAFKKVLQAALSFLPPNGYQVVFDASLAANAINIKLTDKPNPKNEEAYLDAIFIIDVTVEELTQEKIENYIIVRYPFNKEALTNHPLITPLISLVKELALAKAYVEFYVKNQGTRTFLKANILCFISYKKRRENYSFLLYIEEDQTLTKIRLGGRTVSLKDCLLKIGNYSFYFQKLPRRHS